MPLKPLFFRFNAANAAFLPFKAVDAAIFKLKASFISAKRS